MSRNVLYLCFTKQELRIEEIEAENRTYETITLTIFIAGMKEEWKGIPRNLRDIHLLMCTLQHRISLLKLLITYWPYINTAAKLIALQTITWVQHNDKKTTSHSPSSNPSNTRQSNNTAKLLII